MHTIRANWHRCCSHDICKMLSIMTKTATFKCMPFIRALLTPTFSYIRAPLTFHGSRNFCSRYDDVNIDHDKFNRCNFTFHFHPFRRILKRDRGQSYMLLYRHDWKAKVALIWATVFAFRWALWPKIQNCARNSSSSLAICWMWRNSANWKSKTVHTPCNCTWLSQYLSH